jgi:hypothetical protein
MTRAGTSSRLAWVVLQRLEPARTPASRVAAAIGEAERRAHTLLPLPVDGVEVVSPRRLPPGVRRG